MLPSRSLLSKRRKSASRDRMRRWWRSPSLLHLGGGAPGYTSSAHGCLIAARRFNEIRCETFAQLAFASSSFAMRPRDTPGNLGQCRRPKASVSRAFANECCPASHRCARWARTRTVVLGRRSLNICQCHCLYGVHAHVYVQYGCTYLRTCLGRLLLWLCVIL